MRSFLSLPGLAGQSMAQRTEAPVYGWIARLNRAMTIGSVVLLGGLATAHAQSPDQTKPHCERLGGPPPIEDVPRPDALGGLVPSEDAVLFSFKVAADGSAANIRLKNALTVRRVIDPRDRYVVEFMGVHYQITRSTTFVDYGTEILKRLKFRGGSDEPCEWDFREYAIPSHEYFEYPSDLVDSILAGDVDFPK